MSFQYKNYWHHTCASIACVYRYSWALLDPRRHVDSGSGLQGHARCTSTAYISAKTTGQTEICFPIADLESANLRTVVSGARHGEERGDVVWAKPDVIIVDGFVYNLAGLDEAQ